MSAPDKLTQEYASRRPLSQDYYRRARQVLAGGVGHDLRHFEPTPLYIARARGSRKWDVDGHEYVDFLMGNAALLLGHADPEVCEAIAAAASQGTHFGNDHPLQIEWAEWVQRLVPSAERVRFVNSGTEATALALRLARAHTGRHKILRFEGHFHGWHDDLVHGFQPPFDADGSLGIAPQARANLVILPDHDLGRIARVLAEDHAIAAAIVEPSGASWGRVPLSATFLRDLRELTTRHGIVLIFDEVITGFRFSPGGAQQLAGVLPDLTCLAKILAGGMPGGAVAGQADILRLFDQTGNPRHDRHERVAHQGTFNASPLSAAAGLSVLRRVASGEPIRRADALAELLRRSWDHVLERHEVAGYVYGPASTFHVFFEFDPARRAAATTRQDLHTCDAAILKGMPGNLVAQYQRHLRHRGVDIMSSTGGVLSSAHTEEDITRATAAFEETVLALLGDGLVGRLGAARTRVPITS
jgi:glutamate-1-semialdehyde 2,1-aminomutase